VAGKSCWQALNLGCDFCWQLRFDSFRCTRTGHRLLGTCLHWGKIWISLPHSAL